MKKINVTKTFLPPIEEYEEYIKKIWQNNQLTNQGPLLKEFESKAKDYLGVDNFQFVANGTMALQIALKALDITEGEIITTPFSYVATTSAILWERCEPVYVDIDPKTLNIDPKKIEEAITPDTKAILAVHVFGNPCDVEAIEKIAKKHSLKTIYDGAHAFGVVYKGKSLLDNGDISICSFHATKLFHTIEGGAVIASDTSVNKKIDLIKRFGHHGDDHYLLGINAKANEFQAAMGLANLPYVTRMIQERKRLSDIYDQLLEESIAKVSHDESTEFNYVYYPVIFDSEEDLLRVVGELAHKQIFPRRYFYPSLNTLRYLRTKQECPVSEDISRRILALPMYPGLEESIINEVCEVIKA